MLPAELKTYTTHIRKQRHLSLWLIVRAKLLARLIRVSLLPLLLGPAHLACLARHEFDAVIAASTVGNGFHCGGSYSYSSASHTDSESVLPQLPEIQPIVRLFVCETD